MNRFDPRDLGNLAIWLDAQDTATITYDGSGLVANWRNKGILSVGNATQSTGANKPKLVAAAIAGADGKSRPALQGRHDGSTASHMSIADHAGLNYTTFTEFAVIQRVADMGASEHICGKYVTSGNQRESRLFITSGDFPAIVGTTDGNAGTAAQASMAATTSTGAATVVEGNYDGATLTVRTASSVRSNTAALASVFNGTGVDSIFSLSGLTDPFAGYIGERLRFNVALSHIQRRLVREYLSGKWSIALT